MFTTMVDPHVRLSTVGKMGTSFICAFLNYRLTAALTVAVIRGLAGSAEACCTDQYI
jgi:hypothetical protein